MSKRRLRVLIWTKNYADVLIIPFALVVGLILRQIKNNFMLSKEEFQGFNNILSPILFVLLILGKYIFELLITKDIKDPKYSSEDQEMAFLIAKGNTMEFFCKVRPKKLFMIANNLSDTNSSVDSIQKFPWELLNNSRVMPRINTLFNLEDKNARIMFNAMAGSIKLPKELILLIMETLGISPLMFSENKKQDIEKKLDGWYSELQANNQKHIQDIVHEGYNPAYEAKLLVKARTISASLETQKRQMLQQYDTFIEDLALEAKKEFYGRIKPKASCGKA